MHVVPDPMVYFHGILLLDLCQIGWSLPLLWVSPPHPHSPFIVSILKHVWQVAIWALFRNLQWRRGCEAAFSTGKQIQLPFPKCRMALSPGSAFAGVCLEAICTECWFSVGRNYGIVPKTRPIAMVDKHLMDLHKIDVQELRERWNGELEGNIHSLNNGKLY